jgi:hypothetical protein
MECAYCGKEFTPKATNQVCCSPECRYKRYKKANRKPKQIGVCPVCGKEFVKTRSNQKFCPNKQCYEAHRAATRQDNRKGVQPRPCEVCGKAFTPKSSTAKYCPDCREEQIRKNRIASAKKFNASQKKKSEFMPDIFCRNCGRKIPRKGRNWWCKKYCDDPECQSARKRKSKAKATQMAKAGYWDVKDQPQAPLNGRKCQKCGTPLRGNYRCLCANCHKVACAVESRLDDNWIYDGGMANTEWQDMGIVGVVS